ncbi:MAG: mycofactocin biosynthesis chaperone MftB [Acidimicrobiaceae bacterium]|nr:mycofactocin biosynthesis chaperone MftB [Acidimicrobiaceae bacterium]
MIDLKLRYRLADGIAIRKESFGAISYNQLTRQLVVITGGDVIPLIQAMGGYESLSEVMDQVLAGHDHMEIISAMNDLESRGVICETTA